MYLTVDLKFSTTTSAVFASSKKILRPSLRLQVEREAALVAVQVLEVGSVAPAAGRVDAGAAGRLDLDHVGAPVGELAHRRRSGAVRGEVEHFETVERQASRHGGSFLIESRDGGQA